ncbi:MAG: glycoside hydrolase family 32 protein [Fusicatenibacter sp.]
MSTTGKRDFRPKIHFTPATGWMNDPNGMVYENGLYHLYYQYYPYGTNWGPMHWGSAVSRDLLHWEHRPIALYPDELGMIFSGSAVYDQHNDSGYGTKEKPPIVAMYTNHEIVDNGVEMQSIAYSVDGGVHFEKSYLNPVIPNPGISDFRDPKLFWNPVIGCWGAAVAAQDRVHFYASTDLKQWEKTGEFGPKGNHALGVWECPDLFPLKFRDETVWVLSVSMTKVREDDWCRTQYFLGDFDGRKFICTHPSDEPLWLDSGFDCYAGVTIQNSPEPMMMAWAMNWEYASSAPTGEYCGCTTLPRKLRIVETEYGLRIASAPAGLKRYQYNAYPLENGCAICKETFGMKVTGNGNGKISLANCAGQKLTLKVEDGEVIVNRRLAGYREFSDAYMEERLSVSRVMRLRRDAWSMEIVFDVSVVEVFVDEGVETITQVVYPDTPYDRVTWEGDVSVQLYEIDA